MGTFDKKANVKASGAVTASGTTSAASSDNARTVAVLLDVTAVSGTTPTMDATIQWSHDGTAWADSDPVDSFGQVTVAAKKVKSFAVKAPFWRVSYTVAGTTPSFTFAVHAYLT